MNSNTVYNLLQCSNPQEVINTLDTLITNYPQKLDEYFNYFINQITEDVTKMDLDDYVPVLEFMVETGWDVRTFKNMEGYTLLECASKYRLSSWVDFILEQGIQKPEFLRRSNDIYLSELAIENYDLEINYIQDPNDPDDYPPIRDWVPFVDQIVQLGYSPPRIQNQMIQKCSQQIQDIIINRY